MVQRPGEDQHINFRVISDAIFGEQAEPRWPGEVSSIKFMGRVDAPSGWGARLQSTSTFTTSAANPAARRDGVSPSSDAASRCKKMHSATVLRAKVDGC